MLLLKIIYINYINSITLDDEATFIKAIKNNFKFESHF